MGRTECCCDDFGWRRGGNGVAGEANHLQPRRVLRRRALARALLEEVGRALQLGLLAAFDDALRLEERRSTRVR